MLPAASYLLNIVSRGPAENRGHGVTGGKNVNDAVNAQEQVLKRFLIL